jgi:hypothetical protein
VALGLNDFDEDKRHKNKSTVCVMIFCVSTGSQVGMNAKEFICIITEARYILQRHF